MPQKKNSRQVIFPLFLVKLFRRHVGKMPIKERGGGRWACATMKVRAASAMKSALSRGEARDRKEARTNKRMAAVAETVRRGVEEAARVASVAAELAADIKAETHKRREQVRFDTMVEEGGESIKPYLVKDGVSYYAVCPHNRLDIQCTRCALLAYQAKRASVVVVDLCNA